MNDHGGGMDLDTILLPFLIPQMTSKAGVAGIGRFGIGFYSSLNSQYPGDQVIVRTGQGDSESS